MSKRKGPERPPAPSTGALSASGLDRLEDLHGLLDRDRRRERLAVGAGRAQDADLEHAVVVLGLDLALLDALRQRNVALKEAVGAFLAVVALLLDLLVELALAADRQLALRELDVESPNPIGTIAARP